MILENKNQLTNPNGSTIIDKIKDEREKREKDVNKFIECLRINIQFRKDPV